MSDGAHDERDSAALDARAWGWSLDEESYFGPFATRSLALAHAKQRAADDGATAVYLCRCRPETFERALLAAIDAERIIDDADEAIPDNCNASVEDTVFEQSGAAVAELEAALHVAACNWLARYPCRSWFHAEDVERVSLDGSGGAQP
jgi:hypothetical protein